MNPVARAVIAVIQLYRQAISPLRPPSCRFTPTCSGYAVEAIQRFGLGRGSYLALRRLLRCHPWHRGGHDPVPPRVDRADYPQRQSQLNRHREYPQRHLYRAGDPAEHVADRPLRSRPC